jgi:hypothetical protein
MIDQLAPARGTVCAWCEQLTNPADMQIVDIHDGDPEIITDVAMVCNCCLEEWE